MSNITVRKLLFRLRERYSTLLIGQVRNMMLRAQGMTIGSGTVLPHVMITWPHQVHLGKGNRIEHMVYFHFDGIYSDGPSIVIGDWCFIGTGTEFNISSGIQIGDNCLIASGCRFVDHNHGMDLSLPMGSQRTINKPILIGQDVWIGANSVILEGVHIGNGAVVGVGSVVTKSIPELAIAAGVPAKIIRIRC